MKASNLYDLGVFILTSSFIEGQELEIPTPDIYKQLIALYAKSM